MPDGSVYVDPVICSAGDQARIESQAHVVLYGTTREAKSVLARQNDGPPSNRPALRRLCSIAAKCAKCLISGRDLSDFGRLLHEAWQVKKGLESSISNTGIDDLYERGMRAGALGGSCWARAAADSCCCSANRSGKRRSAEPWRARRRFRSSSSLKEAKSFTLGEDQWSFVEAPFLIATA